MAMVLLGAARSRERVPLALLGLGALGLIPAAYHGWIGPDACVENARIGLVWAGALAGALSACVACRHEEERGLALAACVGLVGPMVFRAIIQVYSEHPQLVHDYRERRTEILASHGWAPDSAMARSYERRLSQPDASAWFAMSNVFASAMAGCTAAFAAGAWVAFRERLWATGDRRDAYRAIGLFGGWRCQLRGSSSLCRPGAALPRAGSPRALGLGLVGLWHSSGQGCLGSLRGSCGARWSGSAWWSPLGAIVARGWVGSGSANSACSSGGSTSRPRPDRGPPPAVGRRVGPVSSRPTSWPRTR
ncbi:MAG: hypothetical protein IPJ41_12465 [Phycisphaerales bacterium]|nr:hypothetical protein [Phycisphaerales bacterium]